MLPLSKTNNLGRKRRHRRIEELIEINIRKLVTGGYGSRSVIEDTAGNRLRFVPQINDRYMLLVVYLNDAVCASYEIVERQIPGRIKNRVDPDLMYFYYVVVEGKRFKSLLVDPVRRMIGSRISLGAYYTSQSVSGRLERHWRAMRKARKTKVWQKGRL